MSTHCWIYEMGLDKENRKVSVTFKVYKIVIEKAE